MILIVLDKEENRDIWIFKVMVKIKFPEIKRDKITQVEKLIDCKTRESFKTFLDIDKIANY